MCKSKGKDLTSPKTGVKMGEFMILNMTHKILVQDYIQSKEAEWKVICEERAAREEEKRGKRGKK
jgi:hypothetical protein